MCRIENVFFNWNVPKRFGAYLLPESSSAEKQITSFCNQHTLFVWLSVQKMNLLKKKSKKRTV